MHKRVYSTLANDFCRAKIWNINVEFRKQYLIAERNQGTLAAYANGALLHICRRVKREVGDAGDNISRQSGAAPAAVSLTNLFKRHCAVHGKARTEEDEGKPEYWPGAFSDGAKPGDWFCPFDFGTYDCFQLISLAMSVSHLGALRKCAALPAAIGH